MTQKKNLDELTKLLESHPIKIDKLVSIELLESQELKDFLNKVLVHNQEFKTKSIKSQEDLLKSA